MTETLTLRREYPVPPQQVYEAWTDVRLLSQWFGCGPDMLWTVHEWDVRPGGNVNRLVDVRGKLRCLPGRDFHPSA